MAMASGAPMIDDHAADEAAERHAAAERDHVDAHHAAAHLVGRDQLHERRDSEKTIISAAPVRNSRMSLSQSSARQREGDDQHAVRPCTSSAVSPMCWNLPSHATTSAPTTEPAPENAISWLYCPTPS